MTYPAVIPELETIRALQSGKSIARFGDGEIKLIRGHDCVSQKIVPFLGSELHHILNEENPNCLIGIPNLSVQTAKEAFWEKYRESKYTSLLNHKKQYHSSFISRPDSIPSINTAEYWAEVVKLWAGKRIMLVTGGRSSALRGDTMPEASRIIGIEGPMTNAYDHIDDLQISIESNRNAFDTAILCLGATATCLAWRLSIKGIHALDLGHIGMYYRRFQRGEPVNGKP